MREDLNEIANRLAALHVPPDLISNHVRKLEKWRRSHPRQVLKPQTTPLEQSR